MVESESPDIVILDLGLPDMDGIAVLRRIRSFSQVPVVVLTGGLSGMVRDILPRGYIVDEDLILKGLSIIFT
jgi:CheY-like chemotaxis protein